MSTAYSISAAFEWSSDGYTNAQGQNQPVSAVALDGYLVSASFTSAPMFIKSLDAYSIQISDMGGSSPNGSVQVQASDDFGAKSSSGQPDITLQNWTTLYYTNQATGVISNTFPIVGAGNNVLLEEDTCTYRWLRLVWTNTSGTILMRARLQQKGTV